MVIRLYYFSLTCGPNSPSYFFVGNPNQDGEREIYFPLLAVSWFFLLSNEMWYNPTWMSTNQKRTSRGRLNFCQSWRRSVQIHSVYALFTLCSRWPWQDSFGIWGHGISPPLSSSSSKQLRAATAANQHSDCCGEKMFFGLSCLLCLTSTVVSNVIAVACREHHRNISRYCYFQEIVW